MRQWRVPGAVLVGSIIQFLVFPLVALAIVRMFKLPAPFVTGMLLVAICPGGAMANVVTFFIDGSISVWWEDVDGDVRDDGDGIDCVTTDDNGDGGGIESNSMDVVVEVVAIIIMIMMMNMVMMIMIIVTMMTMVMIVLNFQHSTSQVCWYAICPVATMVNIVNGQRSQSLYQWQQYVCVW